MFEAGGAAIDPSVLHVGLVERELNDGQRTSVVRIEECQLTGGHCYCLAGPSGVGKTTALEMLSLAQIPDRFERVGLYARGQWIDIGAAMEGQDTNVLDTLRAQHFGYIVQTNLLLPFLTVRQNIALSQKLSDRTDEAWIDALLTHLQLTQLADAYSTDLSGGQRQRACIARALAHRPSIVLADEPTSAVDSELSRVVIGILRDYAATEGAIALVVTHNLGLADSFDLARLPLRSGVENRRMETTIGSAVAPEDQVDTGKGEMSAEAPA